MVRDFDFSEGALAGPWVHPLFALVVQVLDRDLEDAVHQKSCQQQDLQMAGITKEINKLVFRYNVVVGVRYLNKLTGSYNEHSRRPETHRFPIVNARDGA